MDSEGCSAGFGNAGIGVVGGSGKARLDCETGREIGRENFWLVRCILVLVALRVVMGLKGYSI